jgi:uncharacterized protein YdiU (UPF0061 family)
MADPNCLESSGVDTIFKLPESFAPWLERWKLRLNKAEEKNTQVATDMLEVNPIYIPRNHLVEAAIDAATTMQDFKPFHALVDRLGKPYEFDRTAHQFALPPSPKQVVRQTFCGT